MQQSAFDPRQQNASMIDRISAIPLQPFREGAYALRVLEVPGRRSQVARRTPMALTQVGGALYLCSPDRKRDWVLNLLAARACRILGEQEEPHQAVLIEGEEAATVIKTYLSVLQLPFATEQFPVTAEDSVAEISRHTGETAVFRLDPSTPRP